MRDVVVDRGAASDDGAGADDGALAHERLVADDRARADVRAGEDDRVRADRRAGLDDERAGSSLPARSRARRASARRLAEDRAVLDASRRRRARRRRGRRRGRRRSRRAPTVADGLRTRPGADGVGIADTLVRPMGATTDRPVLRGAVLGLGMMGRHHARLLQATPGVRFAGAVDPGGDRYGAVADPAPRVPVDRRRCSRRRRRTSPSSRCRPTSTSPRCATWPRPAWTC